MTTHHEPEMVSLPVRDMVRDMVRDITPTASIGGRQGLIQIVLPWPPAELSPNRRLHWAAKAKAAGSYRRACWAQAIEQGARRIEAERLHVALTFVPPDRRRYDLDNLLARMKAGLDGLAAVLGVDDSRWSLSIERAEPPGGYVQVEVNG